MDDKMTGAATAATTQHTPGPWRAEGWERLIVNAANGDTIVACPGGAIRASLAELQANARLIAAAPELLSFVQGIALCVKCSESESGQAAPEAVDALIEKARQLSALLSD